MQEIAATAHAARIARPFGRVMHAKNASTPASSQRLSTSINKQPAAKSTKRPSLYGIVSTIAPGANTKNATLRCATSVPHSRSASCQSTSTEPAAAMTATVMPVGM